VAKNKKIDDSFASEQRKKPRRGTSSRRTSVAAVVVERRLGERREKVSRRRQIDPTTCERDYSEAEIEFMHALDQYKRTSGRMFPTCSEILEVLRNLGYEKQAGFVAPAAAVALSETIYAELC
jgi:hypothetical protein